MKLPLDTLSWRRTRIYQKSGWGYQIPDRAQWLTYYPPGNSLKGVIQPFADRRAQKLLGRERVRELVHIEDQARARLVRLDAVVSLEDLRAIRGNRLEALSGKRKGQFSIRINDQYRICFTWEEKGPANVEIADYH